MNTGQIISLQRKIPPELAGLRLDQALAQLLPRYSRTRIQEWIRSGQVKLDQIPCVKINQKVQAEQLIDIQATLPIQASWQAQEIPLDIIYEDNDLLIINKPINLVVHPGAGNPDKTLVNALLHYDKQLALQPRAGIIHRLDKDTTGLLIISKNLQAHHQLIQAMKDRAIQREYMAIIKGRLLAGGTIDAPIGRHPRHRTKMAMVPSGRKAVTHYRVIEKFKAHTYIEIKLETGRTHQIRVHMNHIHHPVVGDPVYGKQIAISAKLTETMKQALKQFQRQALHAYRLSLTHPQTGAELQFEAPLAKDMRELLNVLQEDHDSSDKKL